jgi:hypothetical protein
MRIKATAPGTIALTALALLAGGCGPGGEETTLSTRAGDDPARYQKAQAEAEQAAQRARAAEAKKLKGVINVEEP